MSAFPDILFENDDLIVLNKPAGLLSVPDRMQSAISLKDLLIARFGAIFTIHRLDRETSGVIAFAKTEAAHRSLSESFQERSVEKIYLGIVGGELAQPKGLIEAPIAEHPAKNGKMVVARKGKPSATGYEVAEALGRFSLVRFELFTGRTHQIRVHMQSIGHPIACDELYGDGRPILLSSIKRNYKLSKHEEEERPILSRLGLHAEKLSFPAPSGERITCEAAMPKDMRALVAQLKKSL